MRKQTLVLSICIVVVAGLHLGHARQADGYLTFCKAFIKQYVGDEKNGKQTETQKALAKEIKRVKKCNICHDPRKNEEGKASKKNRNPFGTSLHELLTDKDRLAVKKKKDIDKALELLKKVEGKKAKDADKTFIELVKAGKLPFEYKEAKK